MTFDENNEVIKLLCKVGHKLNRSPEQLKPFIKIIVEDNWLDSIESLKKLTNDDWDKLNLPILFLNEIKQELYPKDVSEWSKDLNKKQEITQNKEQNIDHNTDHNTYQNKEVDYNKVHKEMIRNERSSLESCGSSSASTNNRTPTRSKIKMDQIKGSGDYEYDNRQFTKKIKRNTAEPVGTDNQFMTMSYPYPNNFNNIINNNNNINNNNIINNNNNNTNNNNNNMFMANRALFCSGKEERLETNICKNISKQEYSEFPLIKFNVEVYNEFIMHNVQDIEVENIFYFCTEEDGGCLLQNDTCSGLSGRDQYDKHCVDLYNAAEKLKRIDPYNLKGVIEILSKIIRNVLITPRIIKTRILKCTNHIIRERILKYQESVNFLEAIGFILIHSFYVLQKVNTIVLTCAYESLESLALLYNMSLTNLPKKYFNPYKASIICTDSFKAKTILGNDNNDEILKKKKEELNKLMSQAVDLNPKIYLQQRRSVNNNNCTKDMLDIDESNTNDEVSFLMSRIKNLYKEQTFQSRTKMELQKISKAQVYVKSVLKILFPDQHVLELNFSPCTSLKQVHDCIKQFLNSNISSKEWFIYEPPVIKKFDLDKKLTDYNLVPCAFLRFKVNGVVGNNLTNGGYFSDEAMSKYYVVL